MKKAAKIIVNIAAWILLIFALLITLIVFSSEKNDGISNFFGYMPLTVESNSMKPTFKKGDMIICKEVNDVNKLEKGDVITFWTIIDGQRVKNTHRITEVKNENGNISFITKGDNNGIEDTVPVYTGDIIGKWTKGRIAGFGKVVDFLKTKRGFFICIIIPMALFFLFELYKFIVTIIEVRKPEKEEIDEGEIKRRAIEEYLAEQKKAEAAGEVAAGAAEKTADTAAEVKDAVSKTAEKAEETVTEAGEKLTEAAEKTSEAAGDIKQDITAAADEAAKTAESAADTAESIISGKTDE